MPFFPEIKCVGDVPRFHGQTRPDQVAMVFEDRISTYKEFDDRTSQVANALSAMGVKAGDRIAFIGKNSDWYFELFFGATKLNAVMVPVNWRLAPPEVAYIANDAQAKVLFVGEHLYGLVDQIQADLKHVEQVVAVGGPHKDWPTYEAWRDAQSTQDPKPVTTLEDVAIQLYTSGTTGHPKGALLANRGFINGREKEAKNPEPWQEWHDDDVSLVAMPIFHIGGSGYGFSGLYNGVKNVIMDEFDPGRVLDFFITYGISKLFMVPAAMQIILRDPRCPDIDFSGLKFIFYGASPIPLDLLREAMETFGCGFVQMYGMTETTGTIVALSPEDHDPNGNEKMLSTGKPLDGIELCIMDDDGNQLPVREIGEICTRSEANMNGYWNLDEATKGAFTDDGWLRTGDAGFIDEDGYVYVRDRVKDMIVSGGENVYPAEVENAIFAHEAVEEVAVIGIPSDKWGEEVKAVIVVKEGKTVTEEEIITHSRERIAGFKTPKTVDFIDVLPRNPSGKILKKDLRAPYWVGRDRAIN